MKKRQFFLIIFTLFCIATKSHAQWEAPVSHYWEAKSYYNPSFAGAKDQISTTAVYQYQRTVIKDSPQRIILTANMPFDFLKRKHGVGLVVYSGNIGSLRNSLLAAQYNFRQQLGTGMLNIGLQTGVYDLSYDSGNIGIFPDSLQNSNLQNNQQLNINLTKKQVADISAGISWTGNRFFVGLSIMHFNQPLFYTASDSGNNFPNTSTDSTQSQIPRSYNFIAGYNIRLLNSLEIQPMVWVLHDENQTQTQATVKMEYNKRFSGGITLNSESDYSVFAGTTIQGFRFGYAYTLHNKGIVKDSHELFVRYDFTIDSFKPKMKPHKSIRLL